MPAMASIVIDLFPAPFPSISQTIVVVFRNRGLDLDEVLLLFEIGPVRITGCAGDALAKRK